jgi:arylsulfatase
MGMKKKYPDRKPINAIPYQGIENLRPETVKMVEAFKAAKKGMR